MENTIAMLTFNVDLDGDIFRTVADRFLEHTIRILDHEKSGAERLHMNIEPEISYVHVAVFFGRSLEASRQKMTVTEKKLRDIFGSLTEQQPHLAIGAVILVDCGEVGMLPLSQFVVIQNMMECMSNFVSDTTVSRVFTVDLEENFSPGDRIHIYDTSSLAFKNRIWAYLESSLSSLNQRFGAVPLPKL